MDTIDSPLDNILVWYNQLVEQGKLEKDARQLEAVNELLRFSEQLYKSQQDKKKSLFSRKQENIPQGLYIHGKVGRGKTLLMDGFYLTLSDIPKKRVHFHSFMRHFHQYMNEHKDQSSKVNPLSAFADDLATSCRILCFDEFHISDIADAMIMKQLLSELIKRGVRFVMTSNYAPKELYPNGLARHLFVPAIKIIDKDFKVIMLDSPSDYRQLLLGDSEMYFSRTDDAGNDASKQKLQSIFDKVACGIYLDEHITVQGRKINAISRTSDAIWFSFTEICEKARSQLDYLRLAERFGTIIISDVPQLTGNKLAEASRRFTWLVDVLYDRKIKLILSADVPLENLYGSNSSGMDESGRTLSRLREMQSSSYMKVQAID